MMIKRTMLMVLLVVLAMATSASAVTKNSKTTGTAAGDSLIIVGYIMDSIGNPITIDSTTDYIQVWWIDPEGDSIYTDTLHLDESNAEIEIYNNVLGLPTTWVYKTNIDNYIPGKTVYGQYTVMGYAIGINDGFSANAVATPFYKTFWVLDTVRTEVEHYKFADTSISTRSTLTTSDNIGVNLDDVTGTLDNSEIGANFLDSTKIADSILSQAKIKGNFLNVNKIATGTLSRAKFGDNIMDANFIATDAITASKIAVDAITSSEIAADAIGSSELAQNAIGSDELAGTAAREISDTVWDEPQSGHTIAGTFGKYLDTEVSGLTGMTPTQMDSVLKDYRLHMLLKSAIDSSIANSSVIASLASKSATPAWSSFNNTTDALEALRDRGDAAWITGGGAGAGNKTVYVFVVDSSGGDTARQGAIVTAYTVPGWSPVGSGTQYTSGSGSTTWYLNENDSMVVIATHFEYTFPPDTFVISATTPQYDTVFGYNNSTPAAPSAELETVRVYVDRFGLSTTGDSLAGIQVTATLKAADSVKALLDTSGTDQYIPLPVVQRATTNTSGLATLFLKPNDLMAQFNWWTIDVYVHGRVVVSRDVYIDTITGGIDVTSLSKPSAFE